MQPQVLVIDDEQQICQLINAMLHKQGYQVKAANSPLQAETSLKQHDFDLIFCDIMLSREISGLDLLKTIRELSPTSQVIMMTGYPDVATAAEATRQGAFDYICKPFDANQITNIARHAVERRLLLQERERYRANLEATCRSIDDTLIMVDRTLSLQYINDAAQICGYSQQDLLKPIDQLQTCCQGSCRMALAETVRTGKRQELKRIECRDREQIRVVTVVTSPVIGNDNNLEGAVAVIRDETTLHSLEQTLNQRSQFHHLLGRSRVMQRLYAQIEALADVSSTVLICGESGTGKELVANALHECGRRRSKPFVVVNCAALADSLLESELFGHVRGAFTGANQDKIGRFQRADHGTIFLDEIGDISHAMQLRLLRVLQEHEIERVGEGRPIKVDVRVIAATNRNLEEKVARGEFRSDLYYRLNVVQVTTPPLRERLEDLPLLIKHFLKLFSERFERRFSDISSDMLTALQQYSWPGNVRQLKHLLEQACVMSQTSLLTCDLLPATFTRQTDNTTATTEPEQIIQKHEPPTSATTIEEALSHAKGNKTEAAKLLGISRRTLYRWLEN